MYISNLDSRQIKMKEAKADLFDMILDEDTDAICITTNGQYDRYGRAIMGGGCARVAADRYPELPKALGKCLRVFGSNIPYIIGAVDEEAKFIKPHHQMIKDKLFKCLIFSFPTINKLADGGNIYLIKQSASIMKDHADHYNLNKIVLPRPAVGIGGLKWSDVKQEIEDILDDRFLIVSFAHEE